MRKSSVASSAASTVSGAVAETYSVPNSLLANIRCAVVSGMMIVVFLFASIVSDGSSKPTTVKSYPLISSVLPMQSLVPNSSSATSVPTTALYVCASTSISHIKRPWSITCPVIC